MFCFLDVVQILCIGIVITSNAVQQFIATDIKTLRAESFSKRDSWWWQHWCSLGRVCLHPLLFITVVSSPFQLDGWSNTYSCLTVDTMSTACLWFSASNSYLFWAPSLHTFILKPPPRPVSLHAATKDMWKDVVFIESKNARDSEGMI